MKKLIVVCSLIITLSLPIGCSIQDAQLDLTEEETTLKSGKKHLVPFKSSFSLWSDPAIPGPTINLTVFGTGKATHMGKSKLVVTETITTGLPPWTATASVIVTAANGDELHFDYTSQIDPSEMPPNGNGDLIVLGQCIVTGGTGRFDDASGTLTYNGVFNVVSNTGTAQFFGDIKY